MSRRGSRARQDHRRLLTTVILALAVCLIAVGAIGVVTSLTAPRSASPAASVRGPTATSMNGKQVVLDPGVVPISAKKSHAVADTGKRLIVPSVGLNVPLGAMNEVDGQVTPPGFTSAYRIRNLGVAFTEPASGTVYVAMHSLRNGAIGPGNYLIDVATGTPKVANGAKVVAAGVTYTVSSTAKVLKKDLPHDAALWANTPDRLVLITCLQNPQNIESAYNIVTIATRAS